jgi:hypothetical protein
VASAERVWLIRRDDGVIYSEVRRRKPKAAEVAERLDTRCPERFVEYVPASFLAAERARVVALFTEPLNGFPLIPSIALDTALDGLAADASMGAEGEEIDSHKMAVREVVRRIYAAHVARVADTLTAAPRGTTTEAP